MVDGCGSEAMVPFSLLSGGSGRKSNMALPFIDKESDFIGPNC